MKFPSYKWYFSEVAELSDGMGAGDIVQDLVDGLKPIIIDFYASWRNFTPVLSIDRTKHVHIL